MTALIVLLVIFGLFCLGWGVWSWFEAFAAGMSDSPSAAAANTPSNISLYGAIPIGIAALILAIVL